MCTCYEPLVLARSRLVEAQLFFVEGTLQLVLGRLLALHFALCDGTDVRALSVSIGHQTRSLDHYYSLIENSLSWLSSHQALFLRIFLLLSSCFLCGRRSRSARAFTACGNPCCGPLLPPRPLSAFASGLFPFLCSHLRRVGRCRRPPGAGLVAAQYCRAAGSVLGLLRPSLCAQPCPLAGVDGGSSGCSRRRVTATVVTVRVPT